VRQRTLCLATGAIAPLGLLAGVGVVTSLAGIPGWAIGGFKFVQTVGFCSNGKLDNLSLHSICQVFEPDLFGPDGWLGIGRGTLVCTRAKGNLGKFGQHQDNFDVFRSRPGDIRRTTIDHRANRSTKARPCTIITLWRYLMATSGVRNWAFAVLAKLAVKVARANNTT
jgi:hypothetical protein